MFAYCNNSPIIFKDSCGTAPWPTTVAINDGGGGYPIYSNIANTPQDQISGVINGQGLLPYSNNPIGLGTYGFSGCQYIAVYNAMQLIGKPQPLAEITDEVFSTGAVACGIFGAGPWGAASYFSAHDVDYVGSFSMDTLVADISEGSVIVFTILNKKNNPFGGWHAMTALYTQGNYIVFNRYSDRKKNKDYASLEEAYSEGQWLYGIRIN